MSLFEQTQYEADQLFYATFPAAKDAAYNAASEQNIYDIPGPMDYQSIHETTQSLQYDIRSLNGPDIGSTSMSFRGHTSSQQSLYQHLYADYALHPQPILGFSHHHWQSQPSYYPPSQPVSFWLFFFLVWAIFKRSARLKIRPLYIFHRNNFIIITIRLNQHRSTSITPIPSRFRSENHLHGPTLISMKLSTIAVMKVLDGV